MKQRNSSNMLFAVKRYVIGCFGA